MKQLLRQVYDLVHDEIDRSIRQHGNLHSRHEAYAVMLEEWDEAKAEIEIVGDAITCFWHCVKNDIQMTGEDTTIVNRAILAACELIQVAAMARKYIIQEEYFHEPDHPEH